MSATQNGDDATLLEMHRDWQQAEERAKMAEQTLIGARGDALAKQARFKGAAELRYGKDATFELKDGKLIFTQPNREQRRAAAKKQRSNAAKKR